MSFLPDRKKNIVSYYLFRGDAKDESRNGNHGIVEGATLTEDRFGNPSCAFRFNGVDSYIRVENNNSLDLRRSITLCAWIKPLSIQKKTPGIVCKGRSRSGTGFRLGMQGEDRNFADICLNNGNTRALSYNAAVLTRSSIEVDKWYYIACTWDLNKMKIYVNGKLESENEGVATCPLSYSQQPLNIGRETAGLSNRYFHGDIDEVLIFNVSLDGEEIEKLYKLEKPIGFKGKKDEDEGEDDEEKKVRTPLGKGLVAYFPFDGNVNDESGNENHGEVHNGAILTENRFGKPKSAYRFNGHTSFIEVKYHPTLDLRERISVCAWINPYDCQQRPPGIACRGRSRNGTGFRLGMQGENMADFCLNDGRSYNAGCTSKRSLEVKKWVFVCGTWDLMDIKIYINGVLENTTRGTAKTPLSESSESLNIGRETSGLTNRYFEGDIDEVMVFNRPLDDDEVFRIFKILGGGKYKWENKEEELEKMDLDERVAYVLGDDAILLSSDLTSWYGWLVGSFIYNMGK